MAGTPAGLAIHRIARVHWGAASGGEMTSLTGLLNITIHTEDDAREAAIAAYKDEEVEIDMDAPASFTPQGDAWVAAWVYVSKEEIAAIEARRELDSQEEAR